MRGVCEGFANSGRLRMFVLPTVCHCERSRVFQNGIMYHKDIPQIWKEYDPSLHQWLRQLTEEFDLTFPLPDGVNPANMVPCLLPEQEAQVRHLAGLGQVTTFRHHRIDA